MIHLTAETKIMLATKPVDFRKQIDGLIAICKYHLQQDPHSGSFFVFMNRTRTMLRILCYEENGYWLATKRLSRGRYTKLPSNAGVVKAVPAHELKQILNMVLDSRKKSV